MQTTESIVRAIESDSQTIVSEMLWDLIKAHNTGDGQIQKSMYGRYKQAQEAVPVFRKFYAKWEGKVQEKLPNDFFGDVVDVATGYMGNAITIEFDQKGIGDQQIDAQEDFLRRWSREESTTDENSELVKMAKATGKAFRLLFSRDAQAKITNLNPWETMVFYDASLNEPQAAMRFWQVEEHGGGKATGNMSPGRRSNYDDEAKPNMRYRVEWYDDTMITYYRENEDGDFVVDMSQPPPPADTALTGSQPHFFNGIPIVEFLNNEEGIAEAGKVTRLIDAYDDIMSDGASEVEQLRMAYMYVKGMGMKLDAELEANLRQTGIWPLPADGEIGFAGKDLSGAAEFIKYVLQELRENIYAFAKSIDLSKDRGGDVRVIGWQIAILRMEMSSQVTERKFRKSYLRQYRLLTDFWRENQRIDIDPLSLSFVFTRKFPRDIDQEMDTLIKAQQALPLEFAYGLTSFIDDPATLAEQYKEEKPEMADILKGLDQDANEQSVGRSGPTGQ